jgi:hypothetical protein
MSELFGVFSWLYANADNIFAAILGTHALASLIVNLTETPKDNEVVTKFYRLIEVSAGIITGRAKR